MYCCEDIRKIENYKQAIVDNETTWVCHHRREIDENKSASQLKTEHKYYQVPASDLIFLKLSDHMRLHMTGERNHRFGKPSIFRGKPSWNKGMKCPESTKHKISTKLKNRPSPMKGRHHSAEARRKVSDATKGKNNPMYGKPSPCAGTFWFTNGKINIRAKECPEGFTKGRLKL